MEYREFLKSKSHTIDNHGFDPVFMPDFLFDFQRDLVTWACRKGRAAIFADCGLGKTPMQLVWAQNVVEKTGGRVLILTPLAVSAQTKREANKFNIDCERSFDGKPTSNITITNYEKLDKFNTSDYVAVVCDESSILKNYSGSYRSSITEFMKKMSYRLLCTATAAPNDYHELGTSSEALGEMGYMDILNKYFKNDMNNSATGRVYGVALKWRFKGHAEIPFWRWVCSWGRAVRKPSDLGYSNDGFELPPLIENEYIVETEKTPPGFLFPVAAVGLKEQREERRRTIEERCEKAAQLSGDNRQCLIWAHLNDECDLLEEIIPGSKQVKGGDSDEKKEETLQAFADGELKTLITKPKIGAFGLNFQSCSHVVFFPSHSYEQYYQGVRRCWRYGQKNPVNVDIVSTVGEVDVLKNLQRKAKQADVMFDNLVKLMNDSLAFRLENNFNQKEIIPSWL